MKTRVHNPANAPSPASRYAQGLAVDGATSWLLISGQVGAAADGALADDAEGQMRQCFSNVLAVAADAGMGVENLAKLTVFLIDVDDVGLYRQVRDEVLGGHLCASTLLVVRALAHPDWRVEIEAIACA